ncbi:aminodeoxychorismate/anthranilate synthase component II [Siculibacillus lacustris]|uniref:Aminodeoxychorismate/anthranilate synthase component II n=1 Tax=Siculibacillus lacustris TaxID=1549641 RepID=A0A4Q9VNB6_9HYPH|nr:aminodeoxychorismate/anthranilate synthase component II [Siculibacillus lacustris]TBW37043.1 aminodeoxychorismate/anthranilate synthase component II [Siculibacillus lacustris]
MFLVIDNYDSFTWNLVHLIGELGPELEVVRNDKITVDEIARRDPEGIVLSPGPRTPTEAGVCLEVITRLGAEVPIFGVCLGHQAIGQAYGGRVIRAPSLMHGKTSTIRHDGRGLFRGLNHDFRATRYHSLIVARDDLPPSLIPVASSDDGLIMGMMHAEHPVHGVQFHPESIASECGADLMRNFLAIARDFNDHRRGRRAA